MRKLHYPFCLSVLICGLGLAAHADEAQSNLPLLALEPPASPVTPSMWSGFYVGSEIFAISGSGRGTKGGVGGAGDFGYNHEFTNNLVIGVEESVGYAPSLIRNGRYSGFDFSVTNLKLGYDMGQFMPYMTMGAVLEKPHTTGLGAEFTGAGDAVNGLFTGTSNLRGAGTVGLGFDYAVTNNLKMGLSVSVVKGGPGFYGP